MKNSIWFRACMLGIAIISTLPAKGESVCGGIGCGGGGTLPANPMYPFQIHQVVKNAKKELRLITKYNLAMHRSSTYEKWKDKFYLGDKNIFDVLEEVGLEIRDDKPCYDAAQNEVDASIYASKPNTICLSAFRIAPKLVEEVARKEIVALLMHEMSHLLGADEKEARELQRDTYLFLHDTTDKTVDHMLQEFEALEGKANGTLRSLLSRFDTLAKNDLVKEMSTYNAEAQAFAVKVNNLPYCLHDKKESEIFEFRSYSFLMSLWYGLGYVQSGNDEAYWKAQYERIFGDKEEITFKEFADKFSLYHRNELQFPNLKMKRIHSLAELKKSLEETLEMENEQDNLIRHIKFDLALNRPSIPGGDNGEQYWRPFVGSYEVIDHTCQVTGGAKVNANETGYDIYYPEYDTSHIHLRRRWKNGSSDDGALYDGATVIMGGAATYINGGENWAERKSALYESWHEEQTIQTTRFDKTDSGFQMTTFSYFRNWNNVVSTAECKFQLTK